VVKDGFISLLDKEDRTGAVQFALSALERKEVDVIELFEKVLAPSLNEMECTGSPEDRILKEHVRSSIVRTVLESCQPYVIERRRELHGDDKGPVIVVACPEEEYHDIGARMVADLFYIAGFEPVFLGAHTPREVVSTAMVHYSSRFLAISVSNYYHLSYARSMIDEVRRSCGRGITVIAGGNAFKDNEGAVKKVGADMIAKDHADISSVRKGVG